MKRNIMLLPASIVVLGIMASCGNQGEHGNHAASEGPADNYKAAFTFGAQAAKASESSNLTIRIADAKGKAVNEFEFNHEKKMHLIAVSKDLSYFSHIHPEYEGDGAFTIGTSFPYGGAYKLFADFVPQAGSNTVLGEWVNVEGESKTPEAIRADTSLMKTVDGKEVELALSSAKANEEVMLTFNIVDAKSKEGIGNLEPYLGAVGHVVILSADAEQYLHVHPMDEAATGPKAEFMTTFPKQGVYKIWGQFQHQGKVFTVPFVVNIN
ncbi:hypothetical protein [Cohnella sp. OV330]|uniref:hypothetical protein n=1 Tax=Cohnella sp. OV330 TaxID=1855288 RepID=UPI000B7E6C8E|nr:hypothetical protein [Cohnella sp. OV330]